MYSTTSADTRMHVTCLIICSVEAVEWCICFQDLRSTNVMEVCCALTVVCKLINKDMMPALLPQVLELVQSKRLAWFLFFLYYFFQLDGICSCISAPIKKLTIRFFDLNTHAWVHCFLCVQSGNHLIGSFAMCLRRKWCPIAQYFLATIHVKLSNCN